MVAELRAGVLAALKDGDQTAEAIFEPIISALEDAKRIINLKIDDIKDTDFEKDLVSLVESL